MTLAKRSYQGKADRVITQTLDDLHAELARLRAEVAKRPAPQPVQKGLTAEDLPGILQAYGVPLIGQTADDQLTNVGTGNGTVTSITLASSAPGFGLAGTITTTGTVTFSISAATARSTLGLEAKATKKCNFTAVAGPTVNDDNTQGYAIGSEWVDTSAPKAYYCTDATTGAAIWSVFA